MASKAGVHLARIDPVSSQSVLLSPVSAGGAVEDEEPVLGRWSPDQQRDRAAAGLYRMDAGVVQGVGGAGGLGALAEGPERGGVGVLGEGVVGPEDPVAVPAADNPAGE